jgi:serine/threonine-protein kinase
MSEICPKCRSAIPTGRLEACPRCLLEADLPPGVLGEVYELGDEIGRGGMGAVYRGRDLRLGRTVAIKILSGAGASEEDFRTRFAREARAMAALNHPNIVAVYDVGEEDGQRFIVMEFVEGRPLRDLLPMPVERALPLAVQICEALEYAHRQGVVHRDVKPENILVDGAGRVKMTDFGIARLTRPDSRGWTVTAPDEAFGTPLYMAPEAREGAAPDPRMDVYALGVVLYEMAMGRAPEGAFDPPPAALEPVIRKALATSPEKRYPSIEALRRDLCGATGSPACDLPPEEDLWLKAVAILQSVSTVVAVWAFIVSVTPRVIGPDEVMPLFTLSRRKLEDGKVLTLVRFETWPVFAALATFAAAITAFGFLRLHWRRSGLAREAPDREIGETRVLLWLGLLACVAWAVRLWLEGRGHAWPGTVIPVLGWLIELVALFFFWVAALKAWRSSRPLRREPRLWVGLGLALLPPAANLLNDLLS